MANRCRSHILHAVENIEKKVHKVIDHLKKHTSGSGMYILHITAYFNNTLHKYDYPIPHIWKLKLRDIV